MATNQERAQAEAQARLAARKAEAETAQASYPRGTRVKYSGRTWVVGQVGTEDWHHGMVRIESIEDKGDGPWVAPSLLELAPPEEPQ